MTRRTAVVYVHGVLSSGQTWTSMIDMARADSDLGRVFQHLPPYEYWSPLMRANPMRRIPGYNQAADGLATYMRNETGDYDGVVLVTHSQGGLIAQRYIARCLHRGDPTELEKLQAVIMFACPNNGSEFLAVLRSATRWLRRNPQEVELQTLTETVMETQRTVLERLVHHPTVEIRIPIVAIVGQEDNVVPPASAYALFPLTESVAGDHNSIIRVESATNPSFRTLKRLLLDHGSPRPTTRLQMESVDLWEPQSVAWRREAMVDHQELFGVDEPLARLGESLSGAAGGWITSIFGNGGAGKTTLAYEAVRRFAGPAGFTRVAWVSARSSRLSSGGQIEQLRKTQSNLQDLLVDIGRQLGLDVGPRALVEDEFPRALHARFDQEPVLIVVDNLEDVVDAEEVVRYLDQSGVLNPNKIVVTTRLSVTHLSEAVWEMQWNRLPDESAKAFAAYLATFRQDFTLDDNDLEAVLVASGGNPLIIRLLVRLSIDWNQSVSESIARLRAASTPGSAGLAAYLYNAAVTALHERVGPDAASRLLNVFCAVNPVAVERLFALSGISDRATFDRAKACAGQLALLTASNGNTVFSIHSVLRQFVCAAADDNA